MKHLKNQQGYALLVVLLIIVLFLSVFATFIKGSVSNSQQGRTVDTNNQSVALAEMGVRFYTADFKRELGLIKLDVSAQTQLRINDLIACIQPPRGTSCDSDAKIAQIEAQIDDDMRALYIQKILSKINALAAEGPVEPFVGEGSTYAISSAVGTTFDSAGNTTADPEAINVIKVDLEMIGTFRANPKKLKALFNIKVPDMFLNPNEPLVIETVIKTTKNEITYTDIFDVADPTISCSTMLAELAELQAADRPTPVYECKLASDQNLIDFISSLKNEGFDPVDFKVFTDNFAENVCSTSCNNLNLEGLTLSVDSTDQNAFNNMNNLINSNLIVNGELAAGNNLINLGKNGSRQIIIVKELNVGSNIQNLYYTNLLVLGKTDSTESDSNLKWGSNFEIDNYSKLCIDIDRILPADLERLAKEVKFSNSGSLVYYSKDPDKKFILKTKNGADDTDRTAQYVKSMQNYTTFLAACDVTMSKTIVDSIEVAVPSVFEPDFDFEVNYDE